MIKVTIALFGFFGVLFSIADYETPAFENYQVSNCVKRTNFISVGEQIKEARLEKKMSLEELAKRSTLTITQLTNVEAGKAEPVKKITIEIEKILEASFVYNGCLLYTSPSPRDRG